jgi:hypothetical protein
MKYTIKSAKSDIVATAEYEEGALIGFRLNRRASEDEFKRISNSLFYEEEAILGLMKKWPKHVEQVPEDVSFERFYAEYGYKRNRHRAEQLYKKLPEAERVKAIQYISKYLQNLKRDNAAQKYPDTYLRNRNWND